MAKARSPPRVPPRYVLWLSTVKSSLSHATKVLVVPLRVDCALLASMPGKSADDVYPATYTSPDVGSMEREVAWSSKVPARYVACFNCVRLGFSCATNPSFGRPWPTGWAPRGVGKFVDSVLPAMYTSPDVGWTAMARAKSTALPPRYVDWSRGSITTGSRGS